MYGSTCWICMKNVLYSVTIFFFLPLLIGMATMSGIKTQDHLAITPTSTKTPFPPSTLHIPSLHISTTIESVGLDKEGNMDVPSNPSNVAWYNKGFYPGTLGNAVFAGHVDTPTGAPAVFSDLKQLKIGDSITVTDTGTTEWKYSVVGVQSYPYDNFPLREVFGKKDKKRLNLITCTGTFDQSKQTYNDRLVVYSELQE